MHWNPERCQVSRGQGVSRIRDGLSPNALGNREDEALSLMAGGGGGEVRDRRATDMFHAQEPRGAQLAELSILLHERGGPWSRNPRGEREFFTLGVSPWSDPSTDAHASGPPGCEGGPGGAGSTPSSGDRPPGGRRAGGPRPGLARRSALRSPPGRRRRMRAMSSSRGGRRASAGSTGTRRRPPPPGSTRGGGPRRGHAAQDSSRDGRGPPGGRGTEWPGPLSPEDGGRGIGHRRGA